MQITIRLPHPRYCDKCPCLNSDVENGLDCNAEYAFRQVWENKLTMKTQDNYPFDNMAKEQEKEARKTWHLVNLRPEECIRKHGV